MKTKLCLYSDSAEPSGMGEHMITLAVALRSQYEITFLCRGASGICQRASNLGFPSYEVPDDYWELHSLIAAVRPDILHCHAGVGWEGHPGVWASREAGIGIVLRTEHLPYVITEGWQHDEYMHMKNAVDAVICVSEASSRSFEEAGVANEKLHIVRNGINPMRATANRSAVLSDLDLASGTKLVLSVGRLTEQKGYRYLLDAVPEVLSYQPQAYFLIAGVGEEEDKLRAQAQQLGITGNVLFLGRRNDVPRLMATCDLFVLPSIFEGLPLVVLEAMSLGRAVVGTNVCGTSEAVSNHVTGRLVEARNVQALSNAITEALDNPELRVRWGEAGQRRAINYFTAERMARETAAVYSRLLHIQASKSRSMAVPEAATTL